MQTRYLERPDGHLAYSDYGGAGELALMLPGMGALRSEYRYLAPALSTAGYRAVTLDLRGQGESSVPWAAYDVPSVGGDILAVIDHLEAGPAHLIGTSFAPAPIVWAAAEQPTRVRSLVLINPFVRDNKINPIMLALFWLMMNNPWRVRSWVMYYRSLYPTQKPTDFQDYLDALAANLSQRGRFAAVKALGGSSRRPSAERLRRVRAPTLVIMGSKDPDFPDPAAEGQIVAEQMGGRMTMVDAAGHYPATEKPEKTTPLILEILARVAGRERS